MNLQQLNERALAVFEANPTADKLIASSDGQFFLPAKQNAANNHCKEKGKPGSPLKQYVIERPIEAKSSKGKELFEKAKAIVSNSDPSVSKTAAALIEKNKLNAEDITGTGAGGKITKTDVEKYLEAQAALEGVEDEAAEGEEIEGEAENDTDIAENGTEDEA